MVIFFADNTTSPGSIHFLFHSENR